MGMEGLDMEGVMEVLNLNFSVCLVFFASGVNSHIQSIFNTFKATTKCWVSGI